MTAVGASEAAAVGGAGAVGGASEPHAASTAVLSAQTRAGTNPGTLRRDRMALQTPGRLCPIVRAPGASGVTKVTRPGAGYRREGRERVGSHAVELRAPGDDPRIHRLLAEGPRATCFVELPGGTVRMGSTLRADEQPIIEIGVESLSCALTPVTNREWSCFLADTGREPPPFWGDERFSAPAQPVVGVSWEDAVTYCGWLSALLGRRCRLPTEPEREYAARGGAGTLYPWGDEPWTEGPFARGSRGTDRPLAVGTTEPNGFGLYHMAENVHEWCQDWYDARAYSSLAASADLRWREAADGSGRRASRGGSWRHHVKVSRVAARSSLSPTAHYNDYGMRVYA